MRGINVYAPVVGLVMVLVVVGLSLHFYDVEKRTLSTLESKALAATHVSLSETLLQDALTGNDAEALTFTLGRLENLGKGDVRRIVDGDFNALLPHRSLDYFVYVFSLESPPEIRNVSLRVSGHDRKIRPWKDVLLLEENYDATLEFLMEGNHTLSFAVPSHLLNVVAVDVNDLREKLRKIDEVSSLPLEAYLGLYVENNTLHIRLAHENGFISTNSVCGRYKYVETVVDESEENLVRIAEEEIRNQLGDDVTLLGCAPKFRVVLDANLWARDKVVGTTFTGKELERLYCDFSFTIRAPGLGVIPVEVKSYPVEIVEAFPFLPTDILDVTYRGDCLVKR